MRLKKTIMSNIREHYTTVASLEILVEVMIDIRDELHELKEIFKGDK